MCHNFIRQKADFKFYTFAISAMTKTKAILGLSLAAVFAVSML